MTSIGQCTCMHASANCASNVHALREHHAQVCKCAHTQKRCASRPLFLSMKIHWSMHVHACISKLRFERACASRTTCKRAQVCTHTKMLRASYFEHENPLLNARACACISRLRFARACTSNVLRKQHACEHFATSFDSIVGLFCHVTGLDRIMIPRVVSKIK